MDFREFLTHEEREQLETLMKRAEERKRKEEEAYSRQYIMLECQCALTNAAGSASFTARITRLLSSLETTEYTTCRF